MRITEEHATLITKELATEILNKNTRNRRVKKNNLSLLCHELENGLFKFNGESIIIDKNGTLLDGQHRLMAVEKTGIPIKAIIVYDVDSERFGTIDTGVNRTSADVLSVENINHYALKAKLAKMLILQIRGKNVNGRDKSYGVSNSEVLSFVKKNDDELDEICTTSMRYYSRSRLLPTSDIAFFWHIFSVENRQVAELFFEELFKGISKSEFSPAFHLRNKLIEIKTNKLRKVDKATRDRFILKAWDKYLNNQELKFLRVVDSEIIRSPKTKLKA